MDHTLVLERSRFCENLRSIVAEGGQGITGVAGANTDLVGQAIVCWEELLSDVCAICVLPIVASSKQKEACRQIRLSMFFKRFLDAVTKSLLAGQQQRTPCDDNKMGGGEGERGGRAAGDCVTSMQHWYMCLHRWMHHAA